MVKPFLTPTFILLILIASGCTRKPDSVLSGETAAVVVRKMSDDKNNLRNAPLTSLARRLEQADAVHREAWWVVANERKTIGKSLFGKVNRALQTELGVKLANKSLFSCDRYFVKREILAPTGYPQKGTVYEKCAGKGAGSLIAEYEIKNLNNAVVTFFPQYLGDIVGLATSILNRKVRCEISGSEDAKLEAMQCENMAQDRNSTQSIQFSLYRYQRAGENLITLKGQVFENLSPMRKIEAKVPMAGKIIVVETQQEAPEGYNGAAESALDKKTAKVPPPPPEPYDERSTHVPANPRRVFGRSHGGRVVEPPSNQNVIDQNQPPPSDPNVVEQAPQFGDLPPSSGGAGAQRLQRPQQPMAPQLHVYEPLVPGQEADGAEKAPLIEPPVQTEESDPTAVPQQQFNPVQEPSAR